MDENASLWAAGALIRRFDRSIPPENSTGWRVMPGAGKATFHLENRKGNW
jgi:hypothetical protein